MIDIVKLRALCDAATKGPWSIDPQGVGFPVIRDSNNKELGEIWFSDNALFVIAAREALPELIDEIKRLQGNYAALIASNDEHFEKRQRAETELKQARRDRLVSARDADKAEAEIEKIQAAIQAFLDGQISEKKLISILNIKQGEKK